MDRKGMKAALTDSLRAEDEAVKSRFERAESLLASREVANPDAVEAVAESPSRKFKSAEPRKKVIRDSFTLPEDDYRKIAAIRERCLGLAKNVTKSEVIRAGLYALDALSDEVLLSVIESLEKVKTGRPAQND